MAERRNTLRVLMTAGEVSGDRQAAFLAREILSQDESVELYGTGGDMMRKAGVNIAVQASQYGSVGFEESLRFVRPLRRVLKEVRTLLKVKPPDLAVLVDNEGFNGVLSRVLHRENIPFVYYFPPQVWLWGEWRARRIAKGARAIIPAFRAEAEIYKREGGKVEWFGHPLLDIVRPETAGRKALVMHGLDPDRRTVALMPGSRLQEIEQLLTPIIGAARILKEKMPGLQFILPPAAPHLVPMIQERLDAQQFGPEVSIITREIYSCLSACDLAILSSGTATLEAALLEVPMVVAYRVSPITYTLGRRLVNSRYIAMPNILLNGPVVPELIQEDVDPRKIARHGLEILENTAVATTMRTSLHEIRGALGSGGVLKKAAGVVLREARNQSGSRRPIRQVV